MRVLRRVLYWLAVLVVSLALVVALLLFLEARDRSSVEKGAAPAPSAYAMLMHAWADPVT
jgi:hypothetical protein